MLQEPTNTQSRVTTATDAQANQEVEASSVQHWEPGLKPSRLLKKSEILVTRRRAVRLIEHARNRSAAGTCF